MTDDTIAALEWAARCAGQFAAEQRPFGPSANLAANEKRAALIRALIKRERLGNSDLACVLAYDSGYRAGLADAIAGGAHVGGNDVAED